MAIALSKVIDHDLREIVADYPGVTVGVSFVNDDVRIILANECHLALLRSEIEDPEVDHKALFEDRIVNQFRRLLCDVAQQAN